MECSLTRIWVKNIRCQSGEAGFNNAICMSFQRHIQSAPHSTNAITTHTAIAVPHKHREMNLLTTAAISAGFGPRSCWRGWRQCPSPSRRLVGVPDVSQGVLYGRRALPQATVVSGLAPYQDFSAASTHIPSRIQVCAYQQLRLWWIITYPWSHSLTFSNESQRAS